MPADAVAFEQTRLTVARLRRRMTKARLAQEIGVSLRMVSLYEAGVKSPSQDTLQRIGSALGYPPEFFGRDQLDSPSPDAASFRSLAKRTGKDRDAALAAGAIAFEVAAWIDNKFHLPSPDVPDLRGMDPEVAAGVLRAQWGYDQQPIPNAIHLLEEHGVRVFSIPDPGEAIDAFSLWRDDVPYIFLNTQKSAERSRHDSLHELGHLILHRHGAPQGHAAEKEADAFASAFLMPREAIEAEATQYPTLASLIPLKRRWRVSLASYVYRLHRIGAITDWHYHLLFMQMGQNHFRKHEPSPIARETSQVLEKVFAHLRKQNIRKAAIAQELCIPYEELEGIVFGLVVSAIRGDGQSDPVRSKPLTKLSVLK